MLTVYVWRVRSVRVLVPLPLCFMSRGMGIWSRNHRSQVSLNALASALPSVARH